MTTIEAVKKYFSTPDRPVENKELLELKKHTKQAEWDGLGQACAAALNETWTKS